MSNERQSSVSGCLVVAPRPVRLSRNPELISSSQNLPTEALEEFLSILKPTFLTMPRSYNFQSGFDRVSPIKHLTVSSSTIGGMADQAQELRHITGNMGSGSGVGGGAGSTPSPVQDPSTCTTPIRGGWFSSHILSSPVSRLQTRNPFARNIDARSPVQIPTKIPASPLPMSMPMTMSIPTSIPPSPAAVPLPVPSPDEMRVLEMI